MKFLSDILVKAGLVVENTFSANAASNTIYAGTGTRLRTEANNLVFERVSSSGTMKMVFAQGTLSPTAKAYIGYSNATLNLILANEYATAGLELRTSDIIRQQIFANGNIVIGQASPVDAGFKVDITGTARVTGIFTGSDIRTGSHAFRDQMYITATADGHTRQSAYNASGAYTLGFVGDLRFASVSTVKAVFSFNGAYSNNGTIYGGEMSLMKIFTGDAFGQSSPAVPGTNQYGINLMPTLNYTSSTSIFTGFYYNPTLVATTGLTHYAMHLVNGLVRVGDLSGTGTRMVVADGSGVLSTQAIPSLSGYVPTSRILTINGTSYDLSADRSWTIAAGVSSLASGTGISVATVNGVATVTNLGLLSAASGTGIVVSTVNQQLTVTNTGLLSAASGTGIAVSTSNQQITITNLGLLSAASGTGIAVSTVNQQLTITNTGILSLVSGTGIVVSTTNGVATITNLITNNNQLTNGAGYITSSALSGYATQSYVTSQGYITGYTETDTLNSVTGRGATTSNTIQVGKLGIGRAAGSNESISVENPEGFWLIQAFRSGASVGGLHTNSGVLHVQAADVRIQASSTATWNGDTLATRPWVQSQGYLTSGSFLPLSGGTMSGTLTLSSISGTDQTVENTFGDYLHLGAWGVGRTAVNAVLVNTAYRADYATDLFDMNISRFTNNSGYITSSALSSYVPYGNWSQSTGMNDSKLYLRTNGDNNHYLWNASDDWEELNAYEGTGFRITSVGGTVGVLYVYGSSNGGYTYSPYSFRSPQFRFTNSGNSAYMTGDAGWGARIQTDSGYILFGPANGSYAHIYTDRGSFYFNAQLDVNGNRVLNAGNYNSYSPTLTGGGASGTWGINITGNAGSVSGLTLNSISSAINPDNVTQNQIGYNGSVNLFGQTDGGLYSSAYNVNWIHQIYGDFRSGQIAIRGKQSGTWQAWRTVLDSSNYTSYAPSLTGGGASGTWGISITGNAQSSTTTTHLSSRTDGAWYNVIWGAGSPSYLYSSDSVRILSSEGALRANVYYDNQDTAYYLNPAGGSRLRNLYVGDSGDDWSDPGGWGTQVRFSNGPHVRFVLHARTPGIEAGMYVHTPGSVFIGSYTSHDVSMMYAGSRKMQITNSYIYTDVYLEAAGSLRAPIFYDSNDTGYYLDPNGASNLQSWTADTAARIGRPRYWTNRWAIYGGLNDHMTGTNGWGMDHGGWDTAWKGGFSGWDIWGGGTGHPQGGGYIHAQGIVSGQHAAAIDGSTAYGWMMVGAHNATENRYWLRGKWGSSTSGWVEMITTGNISSQSVSYANSAGSANSVAWGNVSGRPTGVSSFTNDSGYITSGSNVVGLYSSGFGNGNFTWYQSPGGLAPYTGSWASFLVSNHGDGATYYNQTIIMPFWGPPQYSRKEGGPQRGPYTFWTTENLDPNNISGNFYASGSITAGGDVTAYSDARVKTNIVTIENPLQKALALRGVTYTRTDSDDKKTKMGVIAQEVLEVVPEVVNQDNDGIYSVAYGNMVGLLIEAMKEQQQQIEDLKSKLDAVTK